jgi:hypothetical protein
MAAQLYCVMAILPDEQRTKQHGVAQLVFYQKQNYLYFLIVLKPDTYFFIQPAQ